MIATKGWSVSDPDSARTGPRPPPEGGRDDAPVRRQAWEWEPSEGEPPVTAIKAQSVPAPGETGETSITIAGKVTLQR